jgi:hypothetical protein
MFAIFRLLFALLQQAWVARAASAFAGLLLIGAIAGWRLHWPHYPTLLEWGLIWGVIAAGAWILNR